mmetsp:Transcript_16480/g.52455  ORF Transcript_16480/g.52455 Transcript_16480/m.52455 type:complete len:292 (+) Transcript_16480:300-1175(+)
MRSRGRRSRGGGGGRGDRRRVTPAQCRTKHGRRWRWLQWWVRRRWARRSAGRLVIVRTATLDRGGSIARQGKWRQRLCGSCRRLQRRRWRRQWCRGDGGSVRHCQSTIALGDQSGRGDPVAEVGRHEAVHVRRATEAGIARIVRRRDAGSHGEQGTAEGAVDAKHEAAEARLGLEHVHVIHAPRWDGAVLVGESRAVGSTAILSGVVRHIRRKLEFETDVERDGGLVARHARQPGSGATRERHPDGGDVAGGRRDVGDCRKERHLDGVMTHEEGVGRGRDGNASPAARGEE